MIDVELTIRNYRCFGDEPARLRISDGFTALVGVNNSGKSALLRMLYEIRPLLNILAHNTNNYGDGLLRGNQVGPIWTPSLLPGERVLRADAERDVEIEFLVRDGPEGRFALGGDQLVAKIRYDRAGGSGGELRSEGGTVLGRPSSGFTGEIEPRSFYGGSARVGRHHVHRAVS